MTDSAYPQLKTAEDIFKQVVWDTLVKAAIAALFQAAPYLAVWPIGPIITYIINQFSAALYSVLRIIVDLEAIAFVNAEYKSAFDKAAVTLKIIAHDKGIDSKEFADAKENAKKIFAKYVSFGSPK